MPVRLHGLGHIGYAAKYNRSTENWVVGKFEDVPVVVDHSLASHFFQGTNGYIANLRKTIQSEISGTCLDINREIMQIKKEYTVKMKLREKIQGAVTIYENYSKKRDHKHVNQDIEGRIFE